jgi:uncharacterized membrane protein
VLLASLLGSAFNIPIARLRGSSVVRLEPYVSAFGVGYFVPVLRRTRGTVLAVLGDALVPLALAVPALLTGLAAVATAVILDPPAAAGLAYVGGTVGTLIGADLANLGSPCSSELATAVSRGERHDSGRRGCRRRSRCVAA